MGKVLLSIKPKFVKKILDGTKKYEYRKIKFRRKEIDRIIIYSTSPVMKVVGEVKLIEILEDTPKNIWKKTKDKSGIDKSLFNKYYKERNKAIAYKLGKVKIYKSPKKLEEFGIKFAPQSHIYI